MHRAPHRSDPVLHVTGDAVGSEVVGVGVGTRVGTLDGTAVLGRAVGWPEGELDVGFAVGNEVGSADGITVGACDGTLVGVDVAGACDGGAVGTLLAGAADGRKVGCDEVGPNVGEGVLKHRASSSSVPSAQSSSPAGNQTPNIGRFRKPTTRQQQHCINIDCHQLKYVN